MGHCEPTEAGASSHGNTRAQEKELNTRLTDMNDMLKEACATQNLSLQEKLKGIEGILLNISFPEDNFTVVFSHIQTLVFKIQPTSFSGLNISSAMILNKTRHAMCFPKGLIGTEGRSGAGEKKLACVYLNSCCLFQDGKNSSLLNDDILGATLGNTSVTNLSEPVEMRFWHDSILDNSNATCVFWVEGPEGSGRGSWSSTGCETHHQEGMVLCRCNHLTYFAVLLTLQKNSSEAIDEAMLAPLTYISMVGCSISAAASFLTILFCLMSRKKSSDYTTKIHMNLLGALFWLNLSFLLSEPLASVDIQWLCRGAAAFLHYSLLCSLTWMAIEGLHLYLLLIKVYNVYIRRYILKLCAVGWGLPALPVVGILIIKKEIYGKYVIETGAGYNNATMCWVTDWGVRYILNPGYTGLIVLFNLIILVTVTQMLRMRRLKVKSQKEQVKKDLVTVLGLTCLLGTTWTLAFLGFGRFLIPQLFLFTCLNSLQGLFICLWYCTVRCQQNATSSTSSSQMTK
ncbi:adhesion G-protein coupled receptor G5 isoform X2 [Carettochelys insculpta]|uniref:adhesion G-protein coupled receptor G5 isoform X2 n=1 Tax=Carettochelys insculpta TaxID=44489 RepID=UPI003EC0EAB3